MKKIIERIIGKSKFSAHYILLSSLLVLVSPITSAASFTLLTEELPPYSIKKGGTSGAAVEIVSELFKRAGLQFNVKIVPWQRAYNGAVEDANTCVFPIQRNQEREALFQWISPVLITQNAFYTLDDSKHSIRTIDDVKGLKIGSYRGSAVAEYLTSNGYTVDLVPKDAPNMQKLGAGRIDVWAADTLVASHLTKKANVTNVKEQLVYFSTLRALGCNLSTSQSTIDKLQAELKSMYGDGTIEKIMMKYREKG